MPEPISPFEEGREAVEAITFDEHDYEIGEEEEEEEKEDLLHKNTPSFLCLAQPEISRSSIFNDRYYYFPEIEDPELEFALWGPAPLPEYDEIGINKYKQLCKQAGIIPFRKVLENLCLETLDLRFYGLKNSEVRTIFGAFENNNYVTTLILEENHLSPESIKCLVAVLETNQTILVLNMRHCRIGIEGAEALGDILRCSWIEDLDLSYNSLGDDGFLHIADGIRFNQSIKKLNLSHNDLGDEAFMAFRYVMEDNFTLVDLDISWNFLYKPKGMKEFMEGLRQNAYVEKLNLSWNGIGDKETVRNIVKYLKAGIEIRLKYLDLSNNRICGVSVKMLYSGMRANKTITHLNLGYNPLTPYEIEDFSKLLLLHNSSLIEIDYGDAWVQKSFIPLQTRIQRLNKKVIIGGIYSDYIIHGPNVQELILKRAKFVAMKPKKKKLKKDYGEWLLSIEEDEIEKDKFKDYVNKGKIKLDMDLIKILSDKFAKRNMLNLKKMKEVYLSLYPDTKKPVKKVKKGKRKGKGKKKGKK